MEVSKVVERGARESPKDRHQCELPSFKHPIVPISELYGQLLTFGSGLLVATAVAQIPKDTIIFRCGGIDPRKVLL